MNVHILSNSPTRVNSGFGIVCRNLALGLKELGHSVSVSDMQNIYNVQRWDGITIYPMNSVANATTGGDFYISEMIQFIANLKDSGADVVIIVYPTYDNVIISNKLHEVLKNTIWYYPVDGANISKTAFDELKKVKRIIPMTKYGKEELSKGGLSNIENEIYHGFDEKIFYKVERKRSGNVDGERSGNVDGERSGNVDGERSRNVDGKEEYHYCKWSTSKYQLIQDPKVLCKQGCFLCNGSSIENVNCESFEEEMITANLRGESFKGNVGNLELLREQFGVDTIFEFTGENAGKRKKIDRLLNSYAMMCKSGDVKKNETMLLLHTMPNSNNGINSWDYIKKYDLLGEKILFVYGEEGLGNSWSDRALNLLYNTGDVNVSCSSAEGFGLPTLESMGVGKPQIGPRFSSFIELIGDVDDDEENNEGGKRGLLARIQGYETLSNNLKRALVSSEHTAELMSTLVDDVKLREKLGNNAYEWSKGYTWSCVCKEFDKVIKNVAV